jgi:hypothetical protein
MGDDRPRLPPPDLMPPHLPAREGRHEILLLVHQKPRPKGWQDHDGTMLSFDQIVERL